MSRAWCTCTVCNRVLFLEDGPTCPTCLERLAAAKAEMDRVGIEPEPETKPEPPKQKRHK